MQSCEEGIEASPLLGGDIGVDGLRVNFSNIALGLKGTIPVALNPL